MLSNFLSKLIKPKFVRTVTTITQIPNKFPEINQYVQGQRSSGDKKAREYFYYVDKRGMLYLDNEGRKNYGSFVRDPKYLQLFFQNLECNEEHKYSVDFPYVTRLPGLKDTNFLKFQILPIVFTNIYNPKHRESQLSLNRTGSLLTIPFHPNKLYYSDLTGLMYYPVKQSQGSMGIFSPELTHFLAPKINFKGAWPSILWRNRMYKLNE